MADALLTERMATGIAPLAPLFLIVFVSIITAVSVSALVTWIDRYRREDTEQTVADIPDELIPPPAAPDNSQSINLADLDECTRILTATDEREAQLAAGVDRLLAAIHDEQQKGN